MLADESPSLHPETENLVIEHTALRDKILTRLREANQLAQSQHELASLPFPVLATWSPSARDWLQQALDPFSPDDQAWVAQLPKVELHCHLGGFATHGHLLQQVRDAAENPEALPPLSPACERSSDWPIPSSPIGLEPYRKLGDQNGSALLRDPGCLKKQITLLCQHLREQNVHYAEIRCSPANYADPKRGRSPWTVLSEILDHFQVAASVPLAESGAPPVPGGGLPNPGPEPHQRHFIPFDPDLPFTQSWRDLPHRQQTHATVYVTFRLHDSLPSERLRKWTRDRDAFLETHPKPWDEATWQDYQRRFPTALEDWLDESHGSCLLKEDHHAEVIEKALHHFDGERYLLDHYVIMPNHVHVLFKALPGHSLTRILHSWKSFTAHRIGDQGQVWQHESFDHLVRSGAQLERFRRYIQDNPRKAGLTSGFRVGKGLSLVTSPDVEVTHGNTTGGTPVGPTESSRRLAPTIKLIVIATRRDSGDFRTQISSHLALAAAAASHWTDPGCPQVVGVDLAGYESPATRAHSYREEFTIAHRSGLGITIHAGENDDAEGIWSALLDLNARRLGHALHLADSPTLLETAAQRRIAIEMCPYANLQIKGFPLDQDALRADPQKRYPLLKYLRANIPVTVNTDNIGISAASLGDNLLLAARLCPGLTRLDLLRLLRNAADAAFGPAALRQNLVESLQRVIPSPPHSTMQNS